MKGIRFWYRILGWIVLPVWCLAVCGQVAAQPKLDRLETAQEVKSRLEAHSSLTAVAEELTRRCPFKYTGTTWMDSAVYVADSNVLAFYLRIEPEQMAERDFYMLKYVQREQLRERLVESFLQDGGMLRMYETLRAAEGTSRWRYARGKEDFFLYISPQDIDSAIYRKQHPSTAREREQLQEFVRRTNQQLPTATAEGISLDSLRVEEDFLLYYYSADCARYNMEIITSGNRSKMLSSMHNATGMTQIQLSLMRTLGMGFRVLYYCTGSGEVHEYTLSATEVAAEMEKRDT